MGPTPSITLHVSVRLVLRAPSAAGRDAYYTGPLKRRTASKSSESSRTRRSGPQACLALRHPRRRWTARRRGRLNAGREADPNELTHELLGGQTRDLSELAP